ncbi:MAG: TatD family hydrolase [Flavobacteriales bacterium]|nr:TatD family hydrolase [Flavobacteriales bacterium]
MYIDTHAHLYHKQFEHDRTEMVQRALDAGVRKLFLPNIDMTSVEAMHELCDKYPEICFPMMGLHPCSVGEDPERDLAEVERLLGTGRYWAVGEIGIDLHWDRTWLAQQQEVLRQQVRWAKELSLPVVIHCRESFDETLAIIEEEKDEQLTGVFHCFTGTVEQAHRIIGLSGFMLGVGGVITYPKSGLAETMAKVGAAHCVLETDAPYLSPVPNRGKRNESSYIPAIAETLANAVGLTVDEVARITTANAELLFAE